MLYFEQRDNSSKIFGSVATLLYIVLCVLLLLFVKFSLEEKPEAGEGILINFGNVESAAGSEDLAASDQIADALSQPQTSQTVKAETDQLTQDFEEAPVVKEKTKKVQEKPVPKQDPKPAKKPQTPAEKPREVNQKALFPGRTQGSNSSSEGNKTGVGNQGDLSGDPAGSHDGTGTGTSGSSVNLSGRSLLGSLPRPDYNAREQGRVIIEVTVDQQGRVTNATYRSVGSTTQNNTLVASAIRAAKQARFNVDENAAPYQKGTITYIFKMQ